MEPHTEVTVKKKRKDEEVHMEFYEGNKLIGKCHLKNYDEDFDGENADYYFLYYISTTEKGKGYSRKILKKLYELGVQLIDGDAFEREEQNFWRHIGATFQSENSTYFELKLENV